MKPTKRYDFKFQRSYFDVMNKLKEPNDRLQFLEAVINKSFLDQEPYELSMVADLAYESQRHFIEKSLKGWKDRMKTDTLGNPLAEGVAEGVGYTLPDNRNNKSKNKSNNNTVAEINFDRLLEFVNEKTGRSYKLINKTVKAKYKARLKDGYTKEDIFKAIENASQDKYFTDQGCKYLTPEFFSRATTLDKYGFTKELSKAEELKLKHGHKSW